MKLYTLVKITVTDNCASTQAQDVTALLKELDTQLDKAFHAASTDRNLDTASVWIQEACLTYMHVMGYYKEPTP